MLWIILVKKMNYAQFCRTICIVFGGADELERARAGACRAYQADAVVWQYCVLWTVKGVILFLR